MEDMSDLIKKFSEMAQNNEIPDNVKDMLKNFSNNTNDVSSTQNSNDKNQSFDFSNIDIDTILKFKSIMEKMNNKNDPRTHLLLALKPYLKDSRKEKLDQYMQLLTLGQLFETFKPFGGEQK